MSGCESCDNYFNNDSGEDSDDKLKIVIKSPSPKKRAPLTPTESEKLIIESIEDELEKRLEEKAAKTKLNASHVKNIIKHVVTNEHVLALVRKAENPTEDINESVPLYEPKLTRAKAKELSTVPIPPVPWITPAPKSEVEVLITEELQEDSSGDEYIPTTEDIEESEDDRDSSIFSDPPSVPPPTPPTPSSTAAVHTNWSEDGIFKVPHIQTKVKEKLEDEATIARRTRSKLSLSDTPLEIIEEAFVPPDFTIETTDICDMDCDNDEWTDFLMTFTRPFDEVAKAMDDEEEHEDPEYNILADEEIDEVDREELRVDKAVKVSRKELNNLIAELFECAEFYSNQNSDEKKSDGIDNSQLMDVENVDASRANNNLIELEPVMINDNQIILLLQQMRQYVQILTQYFLLTYQHPEFHHLSMVSKEYLLNLKYLCIEKQRSAFYTVNLNNALKLVEDWEILLASDDEDVKKMKLHIDKTITESVHYKNTGTTYIPTFPTLILKTIANSDVFLYTSLLPAIPFKSPRLYSHKFVTYTNSEDHLIAMGLEEFESFVYDNKKSINRNGAVQINILSFYIHHYMLPLKSAKQISGHIHKCKTYRSADNPIKYYFHFKKAPVVVHYVTPLNQLQILPPCKRQPCELPFQWRKFIYPNGANELNIIKVAILPVVPTIYLQNPSSPNVSSSSAIARPLCQSTSIPTRNKKRKRRRSRRIRNNRNSNKTDPITIFVRCLCKPSRIRNILELYRNNSLDISNESDYIDANGDSKAEIHRNSRSQLSDLNTKQEYTTNKLYTEETISAKIELKNRSSLVDSIVKSENNLLNEVHPPRKVLTNTHNPITMLPNMPHLGTPIKNPQNVEKGSISSTPLTTKKEPCFDFSTISSGSFQQPDANAEVEFCEKTHITQIITTNHNIQTMPCKNGESNTMLEDDAACSSSNDVHVKELHDIEKDNTEDIQALLAASSTIKHTIRKEPSGAEKKRAKLKREFVANLSVCTPEDPEVEKQKNEVFALSFYDKMRERLSMNDYHNISQILCSHEEGDAVELYFKVEKVLRHEYDELADEFLLFLKEKEAAAVNQLIPWIRANNRVKFLRKLETYFKDQPAQLRKIYKCLTELSQSVGVSMDKIKSTLLPMFKGNAVLCDLFLQNFLDERPPPSLLEGPYETIDIKKEMAKPDHEDLYETIVVPDVEDKYGGSTCICSCHEIEDAEFKTRYRHCIKCGTKFLNGKIFIQTGRGLRPATVSFPTSPNTNYSIRLNGKTSNVKNRSDNSVLKQVSSSSPKENGDEQESDDDGDGKKKSKKKSTRKRKNSSEKVKDSKDIQKSGITPKKTSCKIHSMSRTSKDSLKPIRKRNYSIKRSKEKKTDENFEAEEDEDEKLGSKPGANPGQQKRFEGEASDLDDNNIFGESSSDVKPTSPEQNTAESESEFCEESSQDNCETDSNSSIASDNTQSLSDSNADDGGSWKREEDKIILQAFQKENDKQDAFKSIAEQLRNRSINQIQRRFDTLIKLLMETIGKRST